MTTVPPKPTVELDLWSRLLQQRVHHRHLHVVLLRVFCPRLTRLIYGMAFGSLPVKFQQFGDAEFKSCRVRQAIQAWTVALHAHVVDLHFYRIQPDAVFFQSLRHKRGLALLELQQPAWALMDLDDASNRQTLQGCMNIERAAVQLGYLNKQIEMQGQLFELTKLKMYAAREVELLQEELKLQKKAKKKGKMRTGLGSGVSELQAARSRIDAMPVRFDPRVPDLLLPPSFVSIHSSTTTQQTEYKRHESSTQNLEQQQQPTEHKQHPSSTSTVTQSTSSVYVGPSQIHGQGVFVRVSADEGALLWQETAWMFAPVDPRNACAVCGRTGHALAASNGSRPSSLLPCIHCGLEWYCSDSCRQAASAPRSPHRRLCSTERLKFRQYLLNEAKERKRDRDTDSQVALFMQVLQMMAFALSHPHFPHRVPLELPELAPHVALRSTTTTETGFWQDLNLRHLDKGYDNVARSAGTVHVSCILPASYAHVPGVRDHPLFGFDCFMVMLLIARDYGFALPNAGRACFHTAAWLNHGCEPNVRITIRPGRRGELPQLIARALKPIGAGQELLLSYVTGAESIANLTAPRTALLARGVPRCLCKAETCAQHLSIQEETQREAKQASYTAFEPKSRKKNRHKHKQAFRTAHDFLQQMMSST